MLLSIVLCSTFAYADANAAADKVREGIAQFQKRDFKASLKAFEDAENAAPDDLRLAFNRGCAFAAEGDAEKAIEQFQKSAAAEDGKLAALSNYNLGCVAVARAKEKFGKKPEEAEGDARTKGIEMIETADRHFRDALNLDSQDEQARYNLEMLRAWRKYIQQIWKERDRQRRREKLNLLDYLQLLEKEQRGLRTKAKELQGIAQDSPKKRQLVRETENAQRELAEEIEPLKQKIDALAAGQGRGPGAEASLPADVHKAVEVLKNIADQIGKSMRAAAGRLADNTLPESIAPQTIAIENLDQIFSAVAPYVNLVQKGISRQEELIGSPKASPLLKEEGKEKTSPLPQGEGPGVRAKDREKAVIPDYADAAWNQQFIERYGKIIPFKAKQALKQLDSQPAGTAAAPPPVDTAPDDKKPKTEDPKDETALKAEQQRREMKEALQMGVELAPRVEQLAREAANLLSQEKPAEALPKQQEALKLLKEMLPKQQQQQQQKDQDKKDQDKKDQQKRIKRKTARIKKIGNSRNKKRKSNGRKTKKRKGRKRRNKRRKIKRESNKKIRKTKNSPRARPGK